MIVRISMRAMDRISADVAQAQPREACGLLFGTATDVDTARAAANVASEPACSFEIDPAVLIDAYRDQRAGGPVVIGCYHSHPGGDSRPSAADAAAADPNGWLWLIWGREPALWRAVADGPVHGRFQPVGFVVG